MFNSYVCQRLVNGDLQLKHDTASLLLKADRLGGQHVYKTSHSPNITSVSSVTGRLPAEAH